MKYKQLTVYDYTKYDFFQDALALSIGIYNKYNGVLTTQQFHELTYTSCKVSTNLVHAFCADSKKGKVAFYKKSFTALFKLYDLLEAMGSIPADINELYLNLELHFLTTHDHNSEKKEVPLCLR